MTMHQSLAQNGPFTRNKFLFSKIITIIFIYLLAPFIVQNFKTEIRDNNKWKYSSNPKGILKPEKKIMKLYTKWTSTAVTTEFVCKIHNRKKISNEHFNLCEAEISLNVIIKPLNSETNNKLSGNDGITVEFYRNFSNELAPALLCAYDSWGKLDTMGVTHRRGIISAIRALSRPNYFRKTHIRPKWEVPK